MNTFARAAWARSRPMAKALATRSPSLLSLLAASLPFAALADTGEAQGDAAIPEVIVTASPLGRTADELVQPVSVISGEELERKIRGNIGATLESEPGVASTDFGAGAGRPVIRGLAGPRVEMLENGMSAMDVSDLSPDHNVTIAPAQARQIEILKGPATLLYGNSASGGVVNVDNGRLPLAVEEGLHGAIDSVYGSNGNEGSSSAELNYGQGPHMLHTDFGWREAEDYHIPGYAGVDGSGSHEKLNNSQLRAYSGAGSYSYIDQGNVLNIAGSRFVTQYGLPVEQSAFILMHQTRLDLQGILNKPLPGIDSLRLRAGSSNYNHTEFEAAHEPGTVFHNLQYQARLEAVHEPLAGMRGVFGLHGNWRNFEAQGEEAYVPPVISRQLGVFVIEEKPYSLGKLEFGARVERDTNSPQGNYLSRSFTPVSASAGSIFNLGEDSHLKLYATHAERSPVPEELYAFGPHGATATFERGNVDADKEISNGAELGFDHHQGRWTFNGSVYYTRFKNYLYLAEVDQGLNADGSGTGGSDGIADRVDGDGTFNPAGEDLLVDYRQADAKLYGFEAQLNYALIAQGPLRLNTHLLADAVRAELSSGQNLPRIPPLRYGVGLDGSWRSITASSEYQRVNRQNDTAALETPTAGYKLLTADLNWNFFNAADGAKASAYLRGTNLLNDDIRRATSFIKDAVPAPGRSVYVGIRLTI